MNKYKKYIFCILITLLGFGCSTLQEKEIEPKIRIERVKIIGFACLLYANKSEMNLPANLGELKSELQGEFDFKDDIDLNDYELLETGSVLKIDDPSSTIMCREKRPDKNGFSAAVFIDGHTELIKNSEQKGAM